MSQTWRALPRRATRLPTFTSTWSQCNNRLARRAVPVAMLRHMSTRAILCPTTRVVREPPVEPLSWRNSVNSNIVRNNHYHHHAYSTSKDKNQFPRKFPGKRAITLIIVLLKRTNFPELDC